ncbi:nuclear transport factor 2 family protein [Mycobacterium sp. URHB0044]|uniref:nuclear transport factor 2 family protein n=1 Tax=Mycobacterium sp. URHB0044 TaxID=1380386 RepID=UPI00048C3B17|nr:nuclear transport factor 2 family protein [Mycobacterium sp. URHB0044]
MNSATQFFADLEAGHVDRALGRTAPGFTWTVPGVPGGAFALAGVYGAQEFPAMLARVAAALPEGPQTEITSVMETEQRIVLEAHVRGRSTNGVEYDNRVAYVFDMDGGQISAVREYLDTSHAAEVFTS